MDLLELIQQVQDNKNNKRTTNIYEKVLGKSIVDFADFHTKNGDSMNVVLTQELIRYCKYENSTNEERQAYFKGLTHFSNFCKKCSEDLNREEIKPINY